MALVGQFFAGYAGAPRRLLHVFGCTANCGQGSNSSTWRVFRSVGSLSESAPLDSDPSATAKNAESSALDAEVTSGGDDWGAAKDDDWSTPKEDDWGIAQDDDWGAGVAGGVQVDAEIEALLETRTTPAGYPVLASPSAAAGKPKVPGAASAKSSVEEDRIWVGVREPVVAEVWPCLALEIYAEPVVQADSGEHERELYERYMKSDHADDEDASELPSEMPSTPTCEGLDAKAEVTVEADPDDVDMEDDEAEGATADDVGRWLVRFQQRLERSPTQVVRYAWGGAPLWIAPPPAQITTGVWPPPCSRCGAPRIFELELLPTLTYQMQTACPDLVASSTSKLMDWGVIFIFTCSKDCEAEDPTEEFIVVQPSV